MTSRNPYADDITSEQKQLLLNLRKIKIYKVVFANIEHTK